MRNESRRTFIKTAGAGAILVAAGFSGTALASAYSPGKSNENRRIRIGIIGAENSHAAGFGKTFNIDRKFPGVEVKYIWGETAEFAENTAKNGNIPHIVQDPMEMMGKIDALIVDHRHARYHLPAALPFIKERIPIFIDKPFCYRVDEGLEFLALARQYKTPVTSYSSIAYSDATFDMRDQVQSLGKISQIIRSGPVDIDSEYGGIFFYGVHLVQPLLFMVGEDVERVKVTRDRKNGSASLVFANGLYATLVFTKTYAWKTYVETGEGIVELTSRVGESDPPINDVTMVEMFRTGKEPRSHESIMRCVAILEALEKSVSTEAWELVRKITIE